MQKRKSKFASLSKQEIEVAVSLSSSVRECLNRLNCGASTSYYQSFYIKCSELSIDLSELQLRAAQARKKCIEPAVFDYTPFLTINSIKSRGLIKKFVLNRGLIKKECAVCGMQPVWNGKPLTLQLDHINGVYNDNRIENLRLVCPNCHSQTEYFGGGAVRHRQKVVTCERCGIEVSKQSKLCHSCANKASGQLRAKVKDKPTHQQLKEMLLTMSKEAIGRKYGVSGNAVKKWLAKY